MTFLQISDVTNGTSAVDMDISQGGVKRSSPQKEDSSQKDEPPTKKGKQDEVGKLWTAIRENEEDFQAWTNLLQFVDQQVGIFLEISPFLFENI